MALSSPVCAFNDRWFEFSLLGTDGREYCLAELVGKRATLLMFICNHCPYVQAILDRILRDAHALINQEIGVVAISSNDALSYPEDNFEKMALLARTEGFRFPYLYDEKQEVARAYGAECTPDFFGYNAIGGLQYRGRLDASGRNPGPEDAPRELYEAMLQIAATGNGPQHQVPSIGCSIKWKAA
ncbi:thioredoxin family protein [Paracoccus sp. (in: a-proteobacteria)]|uniref:thioredoxin family protein n=1 Tax=Paracoccus sp. TaxID=267 RepID=UPI00396C3BA3